MDTGIHGKSVVITGAGRGLGRAIALAMGAEGAAVVVSDIDMEKIQSVVSEITALGTRAIGVYVDVTETNSIVRMAETTIAEFGAIDILVNNAGIIGPQLSWHELSEVDFYRLVNVNIKGVFLCCKTIIPHMIARGSGRIVNISSKAGKTAEAFNGMYSATKAAVISLTQSLAGELGVYGINVNAICPSALDTEMMDSVYRERSRCLGITPQELKRMIQASCKLVGTLTVEDVAEIAVFLASRQASMMTGQAINITGGKEVH